MRLSRYVLIPLLILAASTTPAAVAPDTVSSRIERVLQGLQPDLRPAGEGTLRMFGLRLYDARLFVSPDGLPRDTLTGRPYALDLRYARSFRGRDIARRTRTEMEALEKGSATERAQWEEQLSRLFPDVGEDDHLSALYRPGAGTVFFLNGRRLGEMPGDAFARAFFAIWLDPRTSAPGLRRALLADGLPRELP